MWAALFLALAAPITIRVLTTLGVGIVTYTGFASILSMVHGMIQTGFNGLPADIAALAFLSGLPQGMAIILSALAARIALMQLSKIQRL